MCGSCQVTGQLQHVKLPVLRPSSNHFATVGGHAGFCAYVAPSSQAYTATVLLSPDSAASPKKPYACLEETSGQLCNDILLPFALLEQTSGQPCSGASFYHRLKAVLQTDTVRPLQSQKLPSCRIEVKLGIGSGSVSSKNLDTCARQVACLARQTYDRQAVDITITLCSSRGATIASPSQTLQLLAPYISQIDYYPVQRDQIVEGCHDYQRLTSAFTPEHITGLQESSTQLQTLHISDHSLQQGSSLAPSIAGIARFASLTKLHLTLAATGTEVDFQPLAHLSLLMDLALQCLVWIFGTTRSCNGVLSSSKQSLHHVVLTAASWDVDTYLSLQACSQLKSVCIRVWELSTAKAEQLEVCKLMAFSSRC